MWCRFPEQPRGEERVEGPGLSGTFPEWTDRMHRICNARRRLMKNRTLPPLRVTPELRRSAESVLEEGETLSAFVLESVARNIEARRAQQAFIERGLASGERARRAGRYVSASAVMRKLSRRLQAARSSGGRRQKAG